MGKKGRKARTAAEHDHHVDESRTRKRTDRSTMIQSKRALIDRVSMIEAEILDKMNIRRELRDSIDQLASMKGSGARQRLLKYLAGYFDENDYAELEQAIAQVDEVSDREKRREAKLVAWRDRLLTEGEDALPNAKVRFPTADINELRSLVLRARRRPDHPESKGAARALLRLLRVLDEVH